MSIKFETTDQHVIISGHTFPIKEQIKEFSGRWNPVSHRWEVPLNKDSPEMRASLTDRLTALLAPSPPQPRPYWVCCDKAEIIKHLKGVTICRACASDGNSMRKWGRVYTGD